MVTRRRLPEPFQLTFAEPPRRDGQPRLKPGPKQGPRPSVRHRVRPAHESCNPVHVTLRALKGLPSFRQQRFYDAFESAFRRTRRDDFRIVEFSVQDDHVHLLVEADDDDALARGMKSFSVRANRLFNAAHGRGRGPVWGDRYHRRELTTAREVRDALVHCLCSPFSSARWFQGWTAMDAADADAGPRPTETARTLLLASAWQQHGLIDPAELPRSG